MELRDGKRVWKDVCVVEATLGGPTLPCDWITVDANAGIAWLNSEEPGLVVGRDQFRQ